MAQPVSSYGRGFSGAIELHAEQRLDDRAVGLIEADDVVARRDLDDADA